MNLPLVSVLGVLAASASLLAQVPQRALPHIGFVYPAGGQHGTTITVSVGGQTLNGTTSAYVSGQGVEAKVVGYDRPLTQKEINDLREKQQQLQEKRTAARSQPTAPAFTAEDEKELETIRVSLMTRGNRQTNPALAETVTLQLTLAPDAAVGQRELRVKSPSGLSNPVTFCVGALPEITAPVVTASAAPPPRPNAPPGRAAATTNELAVTLPALVNGQVLPGEVDRFRFQAKQGQKLTLLAAARALIPYLADAVPGWFQPTLAVLDARGRELAYADDYRFNPDPVVLCEIPADGEYVVEIKDAIYRGREDFVYRIAIGELPFVTSVFPLGGRAGQDLRVQAAGWNLAQSELLLDTLSKGRGTFELTARDGSSVSNPMRVALDDRPPVAEREPNDTTPRAQTVSLPVTVDGRIGARGDGDVFRFSATAGSIIVAEILARRLNSPLDSLLEILDASGQRIASNDDCEDKGAGLLTHHADSRLRFTAPVGGDYFVRVTDTQQNGGPEYGYRLRLGPPEADFALRIAPATINVRAGGTVTLTAYVLRRDGFSGEVMIALKDAPKGFMLGGGRIPAGQDSVKLTLSAPPTPSDEPINLVVVGVAEVDGKRIAHVAVPAEDMMQAFAYHHLVTAQELKAQVTGRAAALRVATRVPVSIPVGGTTKIRVATPPTRTLGDVKMELVDPIPGLKIVRCEPGLDFVDVVIAADVATLKPGVQGNLLLHAISERRNAGDAKAPARVQRNPLGLVPAIPFNTVPAAPATVAAADRP